MSRYDRLLIGISVRRHENRRRIHFANSPELLYDYTKRVLLNALQEISWWGWVYERMIFRKVRRYFTYKESNFLLYKSESTTIYSLQHLLPKPTYPIKTQDLALTLPRPLTTLKMKTSSLIFITFISTALAAPALESRDDKAFASVKSWSGFF